MKAIKLFSLVLIFLSIITSCKKTDDNITPTLSITPVQKDVDASQGSFKVAIASSVKWIASSDKSWVTIDPISGTGDGTAQVEYQLNTSAASRTAIITFKGSNVEDKAVTIMQSGILPILAVSPANQNVSSVAGNTTINITSNLSWSATSNQTWCTLAQSSGIGNAALTLNYQANTIQSQRTAIITFTANGVTNQTVQITQAEFIPTLTITPPSQTVNSAQGTATFTITSNITWAATCAQSWCSIANPGGAYNETLSINYDQNGTSGTRVATIVVSATGVSDQTVTLTQTNQMPILNITPANRYVASTTGNTTFDITSNAAWNAESDQPWCMVTNTSGNGDATLTISYEENITNTQRVASVTLSCNGLSPKTVTVTQQSFLPSDGLVAWYPFNGNANDESGNGNHGNVYGATLTNDRLGNQNSAYNFVGNSKYISLGNVIDNLPNLTITGWCNFNEYNNGIVNLLAKPYAMTISSQFLYYGFSVCDGTNWGSNNTGYNTFSLNTWTFFSITYSNINESRIYLNGILLQTATLPFSIANNPNPLHVGIWLPGNPSFPGQIDDIRIYDRVLNISEIQQLYNE